MAIKDLKALIAIVNPDLYFGKRGQSLSQFKSLVKKKGIGEIYQLYKKGELSISPRPLSSYKITFDSQQAQLEPIYYWILDFVQDAGWSVEKISDNFMSSPGSGHFLDMSQRVTKLQEEGMKILGAINQVVKSILTLIYDLREFEIRLKHYEDAKSDNKERREAGILALKQIWLDNVDLKRGQGSIHRMAMEGGFTTIREAFMMANSIEDLKKMNRDTEGGWVNDQVMRILIPRVKEFFDWVKFSEKELRKRMNVEKAYLKSQVETLKLYSSWMRPYWEAAEKLRQKGFEGSAALVNAFSTSMFELELMGKKSAKVPVKYGDYHLKRKYYACIFINFRYRGHVSQRVTQRGDYGFAMGGRVEMTFDSYALNSDELKLIEKTMKENDVLESMKFSGDVAEESLREMREDIEHFLGGKEKEEEKKEEKKEDINPFSALFSLFKGFKKTSKKKKIEDVGDIKPDNFVEKSVRAEAAKTAVEGLYTIYDIYKKAHGMASAPGEGFQNWEESVVKEPDVGLRDLFSAGK